MPLDDELINKVTWKIPNALVLVGSRAGDEWNGMTTSWVTQVAQEPVLIGIGVEKTAFTHELIAEGGVFSLCTVSREDRAIVRKFTKPVEVDTDAMTLNGFPFHDGVTGAPILNQAPAYLDCEVRQAVDTGGHTFFIGEVVDAAFQAAEETEVLRMEDTRMNYGG